MCHRVLFFPRYAKVCTESIAGVDVVMAYEVGLEWCLDKLDFEEDSQNVYARVGQPKELFELQKIVSISLALLVLNGMILTFLRWHCRLMVR